MSFSVVYLNPITGELAKLPDGGIINAGGVGGQTFTVGGRPLLFADGTATDGSSGSITLNITLQKTYNNSPSGTIDLTNGKDFVLQSLDQHFFKVDAATGKVTISGDLEVLGDSTIIEGTIANVDQVEINQPNPTTVGLIVAPLPSVTTTVDLVQVFQKEGGDKVFYIDANGNTSLKNLSVAGTINGVDILELYNTVQAHTADNGLPKHKAAEISVDPTNLDYFVGDDVQEVLESIDTVVGGIAAGANVKVHEYVADTASTFWTIVHNQSSLRPTVQIYGTDSVQVMADEVKIIDENTVTVKFGSPQAGRAFLILF